MSCHVAWILKLYPGYDTDQFILNPLYTGGLFHCYMLDKFVCHFRGVRPILSLIVFLMKNPVSKQSRPRSGGTSCKYWLLYSFIILQHLCMRKLHCNPLNNKPEIF